VRGEAAGVVGVGEDAVNLDERRLSRRVPSRGEARCRGGASCAAIGSRAKAVPNHFE
jgi:hypothetical protein